jgi:hypothetical protein
MAQLSVRLARADRDFERARQEHVERNRQS